jgi:hypothetical protein
LQFRAPLPCINPLTAPGSDKRVLWCPRSGCSACVPITFSPPYNTYVFHIPCFISVFNLNTTMTYPLNPFPHYGPSLSSSSESSLRPHTHHSSITLTHSHHLKNAQATSLCASSPCPWASSAMVQQRPSFYSVSRAVKSKTTGVCLLLPSSLLSILTCVAR